uniref:Uncharacterized protein n=1 Tax=Oryza brachyantha TaxID=4533 RepID=J3MHT1_ORYBR
MCNVEEIVQNKLPSLLTLPWPPKTKASESRATLYFPGRKNSHRVHSLLDQTRSCTVQHWCNCKCRYVR